MQRDVKSNTNIMIDNVFFLDKVKDVLVQKDGELCPFTKRDPMVLVNGKEYPSVIDFIQSSESGELYVGMLNMLCQHIYLQKQFDFPEVRFYFEGYGHENVKDMQECFQKLHQELKTYSDEEIPFKTEPELSEFKMIQKFVGRQEAIRQIMDQKASTNGSSNGLNISGDMPSPST